MDKGMKTRWISLYVENQVGVLSKISGLFSGKSYNLDSLTVGTTEDPTVSRMTIATVSDDETFEQIKKQLNRMVEVIKVIDFTDVFVRMKEILYIKVKKCTAAADGQRLREHDRNRNGRHGDYPGRHRADGNQPRIHRRTGSGRYRSAPDRVQGS